MLKLITYIFLSLLLNSQAWAQQPKPPLFKSCSNALLVRGELKVHLSADKKTGVVSLNGIVDFATKVTSDGLTTTFEYNNGTKMERIIIAMSGGNELHTLDTTNYTFKKVGSLTCY